MTNDGDSMKPAKDKTYKTRIRVAFDVSDILVHGGDEGLAKESLLRWTDNELMAAIGDAVTSDNWGNLSDPVFISIDEVN